MKEFTTAVEDIAVEDEATQAKRAAVQAKYEADVAKRKRKVDRLVKDGKTVEEAEDEVPEVPEPEEVEDEEEPVEFLLDGRVMHAYPPTDGQLAFMLAGLGRGQTSDGRFANIINVMLECLRDDDKDHFESRLLTRDPKKRLGVKKIEEIFEYLTTEWFR